MDAVQSKWERDAVQAKWQKEHEHTNVYIIIDIHIYEHIIYMMNL